ncbi:MAG: bifunctional precorrin-2 dehydrogenase/sirohydrochlorin ferrochelatase [Nitrososphaeraceae archaeon]|nr:bifunctional precorrin-2 dehydrogenase/sirohydrochlorin ferrochelatase [Nitrososphaeraceae archaeon]MDW0173228.1 bifunctional precorrin-2 dehydrogenase/sirohydrochlorin ferrochelatase [Nitrososphaeraceae archaeon]MDW0183872.1 bifunctional precorrin-2 dehydrogenase/sirohydrochlorin ferrochelatase [Nitrososphaeraceae archaeon]MDW0211970.1 bifunctional precorrin-2 dehydrogenase/sirohydrochlorin ferrochelatase [Nitrososphaeraceae archaeon]MDW0219558.1 bifunctional precorrin-2 dehydrogenase/siroh
MIVDLNVNNKKAVVIGGGTEGLRKVHGLLDQGCEITVITSRLNKELRSMSHDRKIKLIKRRIKDATVLDKFNDIFLILAATDDRRLNRKLVGKGRTMGAFVYAADDPLMSDFSYTSLVNIEGLVQVAISTSGKSPIMARKIRMKAERMLNKVISESDISNIILQEFARKMAKEKISTVKERKEFLYSLIKDKNIQYLLRSNKLDEAKMTASYMLKNWGEASKK